MLSLYFVYPLNFFIRYLKHLVYLVLSVFSIFFISSFCISYFWYYVLSLFCLPDFLLLFLSVFVFWLFCGNSKFLNRTDLQTTILLELLRKTQKKNIMRNCSLTFLFHQICVWHCDLIFH